MGLSRRRFLVVLGSAWAGSFGLLLASAWRSIPLEFFYDEEWRADIIRSSHPLSRYLSNHAPIPPLWLGLLRLTTLALPSGFRGLRIQNLALGATFPALAGALVGLVLADRLVGLGRPASARAVFAAASVVTALLLAVCCSSMGITYFDDYLFQAALVAGFVLVAYAVSTGRLGERWAVVGFVVLPLGTLGGLVVLPAISVWWYLRRRDAGRSWWRAVLVPAGSAALTLAVYLSCYRPRVSAGLQTFWGGETLRGARSVRAVLAAIPRSFAAGLVPSRFAWHDGLGLGLLLFCLALVGTVVLDRRWRWIAVATGSSWAIAIVLSAVASWPVTVVRVNLPFVWLWYAAAVVGVATIVSGAVRLVPKVPERVGVVVPYVALLAMVWSFRPEVAVGGSPFARGIYGDIRMVAASRFPRNIVISYHPMSRFYTDDVLRNEYGGSAHFVIVDDPGTRALYEDLDAVVARAGRDPDTAVWCIVPFEVGPAKTEQACVLHDPDLTRQVSVRGVRSVVVGWFPVGS